MGPQAFIVRETWGHWSTLYAETVDQLIYNTIYRHVVPTALTRRICPHSLPDSFLYFLLGFVSAHVACSAACQRIIAYVYVRGLALTR